MQLSSCTVVPLASWLAEPARGRERKLKEPAIPSVTKEQQDCLSKQKLKLGWLYTDSDQTILVLDAFEPRTEVWKGRGNTTGATLLSGPGDDCNRGNRGGHGGRGSGGPLVVSLVGGGGCSDLAAGRRSAVAVSL